jgi:hypothetical protein
VDKSDFLHKLKGLRAFQTAEQGLRLARTLTGQKIVCVQVARFRTFDPVDIHGLVHRGDGLACCRAVFGLAGPGSRSRIRFVSQRHRSRKKFFGKASQFETRPQVYN